jgi:hypothetical protein
MFAADAAHSHLPVGTPKHSGTLSVCQNICVAPVSLLPAQRDFIASCSLKIVFSKANTENSALRLSFCFLIRKRAKRNI